MIQSLNSKVDLTIDANSFSGLNDYGKVMIGNNAFEFYNSKNISDYILIPWEEIDYLSASTYRKGKWINRIIIVTKQNGKFAFSTKDNIKTLKAIRNYLDDSKMVQAPTMIKQLKKGIKSFLKKS